MDRIGAMEAFVSVADLRGFAPAARRLGVSASAVTRMVAALEAHLDVRLLHRTTRAVSLTDDGARYLERARRILADLAEADAAARAGQVAPRGRFVVAAPRVFGRVHVAPVLDRFLRDHPDVTGALRLDDRNVDLLEEGVDVAMRIGLLADSSLVARRVGATRRVVVATPAYLRAHGRPRTPGDLPRHVLVHFAAAPGAPEWRFTRDGREQRVAITPRFETNSAEAAIAHAAGDGGLVMLLAYQAWDAIAAGDLEIVLAGYEPPPVPIQLVYPTARLVSASLRAFADRISACAWQFVDLAPRRRRGHG